MSKRVRIAIEVDSEFVKLLNVEAGLDRWMDRIDGDFTAELTPSKQLALLCLAEARGAFEAEIWSLTLPCWRPHIAILHDLRKVTEAA